MKLQNLLSLHIGSIMLLGNIGTALAQISGLPNCAQDVAASIDSEGLCASDDFTCVCLAPIRWYNFVQGIGPVCDVADVQTAVSFGIAFCANVCVTYSASPTLPTVANTGTMCKSKTTAMAAATTAATAAATTTPAATAVNTPTATAQTTAATGAGATTTTSKAGAASGVAGVGGGKIGIALVAAVALAL